MSKPAKSRSKTSKVPCPGCCGSGYSDCVECHGEGKIPEKEARDYSRYEDEERKKDSGNLERNVTLHIEDLQILRSGSPVVFARRKPLVRIKLSEEAIEALKDVRLKG